MNTGLSATTPPCGHLPGARAGRGNGALPRKPATGAQRTAVRYDLPRCARSLERRYGPRTPTPPGAWVKEWRRLLPPPSIWWRKSAFDLARARRRKATDAARRRPDLLPWRHVIVDEYKDVNPAQTAFVHALNDAEEFGARGRGRHPDRGRRRLAGDLRVPGGRRLPDSNAGRPGRRRADAPRTAHARLRGTASGRGRRLEGGGERWTRRLATGRSAASGRSRAAGCRRCRSAERGPRRPSRLRSGRRRRRRRRPCWPHQRRHVPR